MTSSVPSYPTPAGRVAVSRRKILMFSNWVMERSRLLDPASLEMLNRTLGKLPTKPDDATTQLTENPAYLYHVAPVPGEADIGILYRPSKELGRWTFWLENIHSDQLPKFAGQLEPSDG